MLQRTITGAFVVNGGWWPINWWGVCEQHFSRPRDTGLVVDDLARQHRSKKMDGVSIHYDHTENRSVKMSSDGAVGIEVRRAFSRSMRPINQVKSVLE